MEWLWYNRKASCKGEYLFGSYYRIKGTKSCKIHLYGSFRYSSFYESIFHILWFIVILICIITRDNNVMNFTSFIEFLCSFNTSFEEKIGFIDSWTRTKNNTNFPIWNLLNILIERILHREWYNCPWSDEDNSANENEEKEFIHGFFCHPELVSGSSITFQSLFLFIETINTDFRTFCRKSTKTIGERKTRSLRSLYICFSSNSYSFSPQTPLSSLIFDKFSKNLFDRFLNKEEW